MSNIDYQILRALLQVRTNEITVLYFHDHSSTISEGKSLFWALFWSCGYTILYSMLLQTFAMAFQVTVPQIFRYVFQLKVDIDISLC